MSRMEAQFHFYDSLNDFLPVAKKQSWIRYSFKGSPSVKDAIEAIGIPHPEVDVILVHNHAVDFKHQIQENDRIEVYPILPEGLFPEEFSLSKKYLKPDKFILDVHLGKLGKSLRILGVDAVLEQNYSDQMIAQLSASENRIVLTRDVGLLKHKTIKCGYWIRSQDWQEQLTEVINRFNLQDKFKPFTRCIVCNGVIERISKESVIDQIPPASRKLFQDFFRCTNCKRIYWKGSHYERMEDWIRSVIT